MTGLVALCGLIFGAALLAGAVTTGASVVRSRRPGAGHGSADPAGPGGREAEAAGGAEVAGGAVACEVGMEVLLPGHGVQDVPVVLRYDPADPYAVVAEFHLVAGQGVAWVFARDLVSRGLHAAAGEGDVRIRPCAFRGVAGASIALVSPDGEALVRASARDLEEFLRRTHLVCPPGSEGRHLDVDGDLSGILAS